MAVFLIVQLVTCATSAGKDASSSQAASVASAETSAASSSIVQRVEETRDSMEAGGIPAIVMRKVAMKCNDVFPIAAGSELGVEDPWVKSGMFTTGDSEIDAFIKGMCDENSTSKDPSVNAYNTYVALLSQYPTTERLNNRHPDFVGWQYDYTRQFLTDGGGNCFNNAAAMQWVLRYFGYEDATAQLAIVLLQTGNESDHGAVFVTDVYHGNRQCIVDDALKADGWMIDANEYIYQAIDIGDGLDPNSFFVKNAEGIIGPPAFWYNAALYGDTEETAEAPAEESNRSEDSEG